MSRWLRFICIAGVLSLCISNGPAEDAELDIYYSFVVVIGYDEIPPEGLELEYQSMLECQTGQEKVVAELEKSDDAKLKYVILDCKRVEK
jgi:hypothetical protein